MKVYDPTVDGSIQGADAHLPAPFQTRLIGRIPVRNIWLLMLYASEVSTLSEHFQALLERDLDNLPGLVGRLLANEVRRRLARNLSLGYRHRASNLARVRGRIDLLATVSGQLLERGLVACRFEEITIDTVRNRFVRAALERIALYPVDQSLVRECRSLVKDLERAGVSRVLPSRAEIAKDQIGRNDSVDLVMMSLAKLAFDLALPMELPGATPLPSPNREEHWVRRLFEKAIGGFCRTELVPLGWNVRTGLQLQWPISASSPGANAITPGMRTDIILDSPEGKRIVIDTKFTSITAGGWYRDESLKTGYLYQMYAYLRSQEDRKDSSNSWNIATGILLHPATDKILDEFVVIQGHRIRFCTVDLSRDPSEIRQALRTLLGSVD